MDKPRPRSMDITPPRRPEAVRRTWRPSRQQMLLAAISFVALIGLLLAAHWYKHRNDQVVLQDRYQVVYLLSGQVYFGKLQNTAGSYLTLKNVYTLQSDSSAAEASNETNILQVSTQVYGPEDSMAIRADQVQFWQNLQSDSKVAEAIRSANQ